MTNSSVYLCVFERQVQQTVCNSPDLLCKRPPRCLTVTPQSQRVFFLRIKMLLQQVRPQTPRSSQLGNLLQPQSHHVHRPLRSRYSTLYSQCLGQLSLLPSVGLQNEYRLSGRVIIKWMLAANSWAQGPE